LWEALVPAQEILVDAKDRSNNLHDSNSSSDGGSGTDDNNRILKHSEFARVGTRCDQKASKSFRSFEHGSHANGYEYSFTSSRRPYVLQQLEAFLWCAIRDTPPNSKNWQRWERGGTVFKCRNVLDGRDYAVKKVTIVGETTEESFQQRLQRVLRK
jgi:hypothetical protein